MKASLLVVLALAVFVAAPARADVKLPSVINENMVLQRDTKVPIWGTAAPGEKVTVTFSKQTVSATADAGGKWSVTLKPLKAGGPFEMAVAGKNTITLKNVLVGEVWVCSCQSNMEMSLGGWKNTP